MNSSARSFLTGEDARIDRDAFRNTSWYEDPVIGPYGIKDNAKDELERNPSDKRKVASVLAERKVRGSEGPILIVSKDAKAEQQEESKWTSMSTTELLGQYPRNGVELLEESLINISWHIDHPSEQFTIERQQYWMLYSFDVASACYVRAQLLAMGLIQDAGSENMGHTTVSKFQITARGWEKLGSLRSASTSSRQQAFVAMWFHKDMEEFYTAGISEAVEACGLRPFRIDLKEHNNKICDEIIAEIRRSRLLIADFTGNRGGVYFEAGFAHGLGIPVIWTVQEDCKDLHFDTRQYNHIIYKSKEELRSRLVNRIRATVPLAVGTGSA